MEHTELELQAYSAHQRISEIEAALLLQAEDAAASQFRKDFERLAFLIVDQDWHLPPDPHNSLLLAPFRTAPIPRRLPFGPLRRTARFLGIETLKYLFRMGSDNSFERYRLELRLRLLKEIPDAGERRKTAKRNGELIRFGGLVLGFEEGGCGRGKARRKAATEMGNKFKNKNDRTLIRMFNDFAALCSQRGHVPHLGVGYRSDAKPRFPLRKVARARAGAKRIRDRQPK